MRRLSVAIAGLVLALLLGGCAETRDHARAVFMLVDTSGTYTEELKRAQVIVNYLLGSLQPGDSLAIARVGSRSFSEKEIVAKVTFDRRPSEANAQKRAFRARFDAFAASAESQAHTDITGALIQAAQYLRETGAGHQTVLIFSDMQEDLDRATVRNFPIDLKGLDIVAVNVIKLRADNRDPRLYMGRLENWEKRVTTAGARDWRVINDLERLDTILKRS